MKNKRWILASIIILFMILCFVWWFEFPRNTVTINIPQGSSAHYIAKELKAKGLITSERMFLMLVKLAGASEKLKAGAYVIPSRISVFGVFKMILEGKSRFYKVTIPEGFTSTQIAEILAEDKIIDKEKFLQIVKEKGLEGYLFPETYFFDPGLKEEQIIDILVQEFNRNYNENSKTRAKELKLSDKQVVILASIIEKEAYKPEERPKISAVFHNRLKKHWYLESCATVLYALGKHKERLLYKDLRVDSPYNTYKHIGLPPGPICNPGSDSLNAALYPSESNEMFFVVGSSGTHIFSRYLNEHIKNKKVSKNAKKKNLP